MKNSKQEPQRKNFGKQGMPQRADYEGTVNETGSDGGARLRGRNVSSDFNGGAERDAGKKVYKGEAYMNSVDEPKFQSIDHRQIGPEEGLGMMKSCADFKREASGQAFGQAGIGGCKMDYSRIHNQFRPVYSDDTGY